MATADVIVVGGGISGLALAWQAARAGRRALVLERGGRVGGCLHSHRTPDGFWFEMGAHTTYNSYGAFLDVAVGAGVADRIVPRGPARKTFGLLTGERRRLAHPAEGAARAELARGGPRLPAGRPQEEGGAHRRLVVRGAGRPAELRPPALRVPRGGPVADAPTASRSRGRARSSRSARGARSSRAASACAAGCRPCATPSPPCPASTVETGVEVARVARGADGFAVTTADGRTLEAPRAAIAAPADEAAAMLRRDFARARGGRSPG